MPSGGKDAFIIDHEMANWLYKSAIDRTHLHYHEKHDASYGVKAGLDRDVYIREHDWLSRHDDEDWLEKGGPMAPDFVGSPVVDFYTDKVRAVDYSAVVVTTPGAWYTFEWEEKAEEGFTRSLIRIPTHPDVMDDVEAFIADNGGEIFHRGAVRFEERFEDAISGDVPGPAMVQMTDVHAHLEDFDGESDFKSTVRKMHDLVERSVRANL